MRYEPTARDYPGGWELDSADDAEVNERLLERANGHLRQAATDPDEAREMFDCIDDHGVFLRDVLALVAELREETACYTDGERIERFTFAFDRLLSPIADARTSFERGEVEQEIIRECHNVARDA